MCDLAISISPANHCFEADQCQLRETNPTTKLKSYTTGNEKPGEHSAQWSLQQLPIPTEATGKRESAICGPDSRILKQICLFPGLGNRVLANPAVNCSISRTAQSSDPRIQKLPSTALDCLRIQKRLWNSESWTPIAKCRNQPKRPSDWTGQAIALAVQQQSATIPARKCQGQPTLGVN